MGRDEEDEDEEEEGEEDWGWMSESTAYTWAAMQAFASTVPRPLRWRVLRLRDEEEGEEEEEEEEEGEVMGQEAEYGIYGGTVSMCVVRMTVGEKSPRGSSTTKSSESSEREEWSLLSPSPRGTDEAEGIVVVVVVVVVEEL
jgi:hypothetical protein